MGGLSIWHWLIVIAVVLLLFGGRGKVSNLMGDVAKGVKAFKQGMKDDPEDEPRPDPAPRAALSSEAVKPASAPVGKDETVSH